MIAQYTQGPEFKLHNNEQIHIINKQNIKEADISQTVFLKTLNRIKTEALLILKPFIH